MLCDAIRRSQEQWPHLSHTSASTCPLCATPLHARKPTDAPRHDHTHTSDDTTPIYRTADVHTQCNRGHNRNMQAGGTNPNMQAGSTHPNRKCLRCDDVGQSPGSVCVCSCAPKRSIGTPHHAASCVLLRLGSTTTTGEAPLSACTKKDATRQFGQNRRTQQCTAAAAAHHTIRTRHAVVLLLHAALPPPWKTPADNRKAPVVTDAALLQSARDTSVGQLGHATPSSNNALGTKSKKPAQH